MKDKMSIEGDLRAKRESAASSFFGRKIKNPGKPGITALPYRKPKIEGGEGPRAV